MATLTLTGYDNAKLQANSIIGWDGKAFKMVSSLGSGKDALHSAGTVKKNDAGYWAVNFSGNTAAENLTSFTDTTAGRNWSISAGDKNVLAAVTTGNGNDSITIGKTGAALNINTGAGNDYINLSTAADATTITAGAGNDSIVVGKVNASLKIDLGEGRDSVVVTSVASKLTITGTGNDANYVAISAVDGTNGSLAVSFGAGNDSLLIGGATNTSAVQAKDGVKVAGSIALGGGKDYVLVSGGLDKATISGDGDSKTIAVGGEVTDSSITTGSGKDSVILKGEAKSTKVSTGSGADSLVLGKLTESTVDAGADNDVVVFDGTGAGVKDSTVDLGAGNDTISLGSGSFADFNLTTGAGKDKIALDTFQGTVTLTDFDATNDTIVTSTTLTRGTDEGVVSVGSSSAKLKINETNGFYAIHTTDANGDNEQYIAWGGENSAVINGSNMKKSLTLYGNTDIDVVDSLIGGSKSDTLVVGAGNYAYGGGGSDSVVLNDAASDTQEFVGLASAGGKDVVDNFKTVNNASIDADEADVVYLFQNNISSLKLKTDSANNLVTKVGTATLTLNSVDASVENTINVKDNSGKTYSVDYVGGTASLAADTEKMANFYYGGGSDASLDFSAVEDDLVVDLSNRKMSYSGKSLTSTNGSEFYGKFTSVTGGSDTTVMMGSSTKGETLTAGAGNTTLWGGGSKGDLLVASSNSDANQVYFYTTGDGKDTIQSSNWGNGDNADILWLGTSAISKVKNDGTNTSITLESGDKLTLAGYNSVDTAVKYSVDSKTVQEAKIGLAGQSNTWTYDEGVTMYVGGKDNALNVDSTVDSANIWLNGATGKVYDNVATVDASSNSGTVILAGSEANNVLIASAGASSLWGGAGNDTLQGTNGGVNEFYFGKGCGNDIVTNSGSDDKVVLYDVAMGDVAGAEETSDGSMKLTLTDGSTLTVSGSASVYHLGDGSTWTYDASEKHWAQS